jgi:hypothetical protein
MRYYSLLIVLLLSACYSSKKAEKQVGKALLYHPEIVATIARNAFPCFNVKVDTITKEKMIMVDCPESDSTIIYVRENAIHETIHDTIHLTRNVKVPVKVQDIMLYTYYEDSAKIKLLQNQIYKLTTNENILTYKISNKNRVIKYLIIFIVCLSIPFLFKLLIKKLS